MLLSTVETVGMVIIFIGQAVTLLMMIYGCVWLYRHLIRCLVSVSAIVANKFVMMVFGGLATLSISKILIIAHLWGVLADIDEGTIIALRAIQIVVWSFGLVLHMLTLRIRTSASIVPDRLNTLIKIHLILAGVALAGNSAASILYLNPAIPASLIESITGVVACWGVLFVEVSYLVCFWRFTRQTKEVLGSKPALITGLIARDGVKVTSIVLIGLLWYCAAVIAKQNFILYHLFQTFLGIHAGIVSIMWVNMKVKIDNAKLEQNNAEVTRPTVVATVSKVGNPDTTPSILSTSPSVLTTS